MAVQLPPPPPRFADAGEISDPDLLPAAPLVSVLVITYRHETVLAECIAGIVAQRAAFPFEIVIAEDNSPDGTRRVAAALQRQHPGLVRVVFTAANKGGTVNSIFGISRCRGRYIAVCDGDDFWIDPGKLARQAEALERLPQVDTAFSSGFRLYPDGERVRDWVYGEEERIVPASELVSGLGWLAPPASLFFRGEILRTLPPWFEHTPFGDFQIIVAGTVRGGAFYDPRPTICYRLGHPSSFTVTLDQASTGARERHLRDALKAVRLTCEHYRLPVRHASARLNDYRLSLGKLLWSSGRRMEALRTLARLGPRFVLSGALRRVARRIAPPQAEASSAR